MPAYHIHITGLVQGVGFRPFVYQLANQMHLHGWVCNGSDGVHIEINAEEQQANDFYHSVIQSAPVLSKITGHRLYKISNITYTDFTIIESKTGTSANLMLAPDFALCEDCKRELHDAASRRYHYPFITCTNCGPRYSIINALPYDRAATTMESFNMCQECSEEYHDPANRRHYSQTNSCNHCGIVLTLFSNKAEKLSNDCDTVIANIVTALNDKKIIAVKGIGGYLLLCDAADEAVIKELRKRKNRPGKPFALMYPSIETVKNDFTLSEQEMQCLQSPQAPIVLLKTLAMQHHNLAISEIAPGLSSLGIMLPYAPLLELIAAILNKPLVATSANISDSPIIYTDTDALEQLTAVADYIVTHNREIVIPQDDSVLKFTPLHHQPIVIRRSKGMTPSFFEYNSRREEVVLATGALLKSSFTFSCNGNTYVSQYLGNTDSYEAQEAWKKTVAHFISLFNKQPSQIIADMHPLYFSHQFAKQACEEYNCSFTLVQHHKAHAAAVLAENNLLQAKEPVLCVVWDGTGLGDDGNIWGGEFFKYDNHVLQRCCYFDYFPVIAADKMAREPRLSAMAACNDVAMAKSILEKKFSREEWRLYNKVLENRPAVLCSSAGRIFDAVASLLGLCDKQSYEGEAAMLLEETAAVYFQQHGYKSLPGYFINSAHSCRIPTTTLMSGIVADIQQGLSKEWIAAKFHYSLVHLIAVVAGNLNTNSIAFSGGVFQNSALVDLVIEHLGKQFKLFFHKVLSPNDENVSFGQLVYVDNNVDGVKYERGIMNYEMNQC